MKKAKRRFEVVRADEQWIGRECMARSKWYPLRGFASREKARAYMRKARRNLERRGYSGRYERGALIQRTYYEKQKCDVVVRLAIKAAASSA